MTSPLLTTQDIYNFIESCISNIKPRYFTIRGLSKELNIPYYRIKFKFPKMGLKPDYMKGNVKYYDRERVLKWIQESCN